MHKGAIFNTALYIYTHTHTVVCVVCTAIVYTYSTSTYTQIQLAKYSLLICAKIQLTPNLSEPIT